MFKERTLGLKSVCNWLFWLCFMVFCMMVIGAITRLTDSGLSMVEWRLLWGFLPPLNADEWWRVFYLYQDTAQYQSVNAGMSMEEFKKIFWWEYIHRLWGRLIGVLFILGFLYLAIAKKLNARTLVHLPVILLLGSLQAFLGWWMVAGGLQFRISVEPYRLMLHLGLAFILFGYLVWLYRLNLCELNRKYRTPANAKIQVMFLLCLLFIFVAILLGALVASLKGGLVHNDWPLMGGQFIPHDYFLPEVDGFIANAIENPSAAQFHHRNFALLILPLLVFYRYYITRSASTHLYSSADVMLLLAAMQTALGVVTLILQIPIFLAVAHQALAALLFASAIWHWRDVRGFV